MSSKARWQDASEPPASGRRHVRSGSVSVRELIMRQAATRGPSPAAAVTSPKRAARSRTEPATTSPRTPRDTRDATAQEHNPTTHRQRPSRVAQLAKITGLGVAVVVLCGSVAAASIITNERQNDAATGPALELTGEQALLPEELNRTIPPDGAGAPHHSSGSASTAVTGPASPPARTATTVSDTESTNRSSSPKRTGATGVEPTGPADQMALVREFFRALPTQPDSAFAMLAPGVVNTGLVQFLDSWQSVTDIDVIRLTERADGVLAEIQLHLVDGGHLHLRELLTVSDDTTRIVGVTLLSAHRS